MDMHLVWRGKLVVDHGLGKEIMVVKIGLGMIHIVVVVQTSGNVSWLN
jgi:hypothetical protein